MKRDLDQLMSERGLDAIFVSGKTNGNPPVIYMTGGAKIINAFVLKKRGDEGVLLCFPIDREEAETSGYKVVTTNQYDYEGIVKAIPDRLLAIVELFKRFFADFNVNGKVGFYGFGDQGSTWILLNAIQNGIETIEVCGEYGISILDQARATKDEKETARIREVGRKTTTIMGEIVEFLQSHAVKDEILVQKDGAPLTVGRVHQEVIRRSTEQGLEIPEGLIFSIGRDAGVPHNHGNPTDEIRLGKSIIFDFAPREVGGGYYFDMTRTFCLGYAPDEVEKTYEDVREISNKLTTSYKAGNNVRMYQRMTYEFFESRGHPTIGSQPGTLSGFIHGLGHGIGLAVHEEPFFSDQPSNHNVIQPGNIFTCEPGLYYPDKGFGVRIEDVISINEQGDAVNFTDFPKELIVKM